MNEHNELILSQYRENIPNYQKIKAHVMETISKALKGIGILPVTVESRIKEEKSLAGKLELKGLKYHSIFDITDIVGARVVTFYSDEVDKVAVLIEKLFEIDRENSVDKRKAFDKDRFGYMSLHYICRIPKSELSEEDADLNNIRFEIQIKTALQHVWATINHDLGYKTDVEIPREYSRSLFRLAGLLEIADEEFKTFRTNINEYRRKILALIKDGKFDDITLNGDSFKNYMQAEPFAKLTSELAASLNVEIQEVSYLPYLDVLNKIGIKTLGDIERMKKDYAEDVKHIVLSQMQGKELDIMASTVTIQNYCVVYVLKHEGGAMDVKAIFDILYGERDRNLNTAKRLIDLAKELSIVN